MSKSIINWLESGKYLPEFMRDFHDQKDVFKTIHSFVRSHSVMDEVNWINGHMYVIDVFLWFMAKRGYTLQRSKANLPFDDIQVDIKKCKDFHDKQFTELISPNNNTK